MSKDETNCNGGNDIPPPADARIAIQRPHFLKQVLLSNNDETGQLINTTIRYKLEMQFWTQRTVYHYHEAPQKSYSGSELEANTCSDKLHLDVQFSCMASVKRDFRWRQIPKFGSPSAKAILVSRDIPCTTKFIGSWSSAPCQEVRPICFGLQTRSNAPEQCDANLRGNLYCESMRGQAKFNEFLILLTPRCQI